MNSIAQWLNGSKDYATGVALYNTYGRNDLLKASFAQGKSSFREKKLIEALTELSKNFQPNPEPTEIRQPIKKEPEKITVAIGASILPENKANKNEDPYREEWMTYFKEMKALQHDLEFIETQAKRGKVAHRILALERKCMFCWWKRDYYLKYKEHPSVEEKSKEVTDMNQCQKKLHNLRSYVSKLRKKLEANPNDSKSIIKLKEFSDEIERLENILNNSIIMGLVDVNKVLEDSSIAKKEASITESDLPMQVAAAEDNIESIMNAVKEHEAVQFVSNGAWSMHELLFGLCGYLHELDGPLVLYISSYAMSESAARIIALLKEEKILTHVSLLIDNRSDVHRANSLQLMMSISDELSLVPCHAKATVIMSKRFQLTVLGSANYTENKRFEIGIISKSRSMAHFHKSWILKAIKEYGQSNIG